MTKSWKSKAPIISAFKRYNTQVVIRTSIVIIAAMIAGCSYSSKHDAERACENWAKKGGEYTERYQRTEFHGILGERKRVETFEQVPIRDCEWEEVTRQFLGFEKKKIKAGATVDKSGKNYGREITKRFKY